MNCRIKAVLIGIAWACLFGGCMDIGAYYVPSNAAVMPATEACAVRQGSIDMNEDIRLMEKQGLVVMGRVEFPADQDVSYWPARIGELGTQKHADTALWYFRFGGNESRTNYMTVPYSTRRGTGFATVPVVETFPYQIWTGLFFAKPTAP